MSGGRHDVSGRPRIYLMRHGEVAYFRPDGSLLHPKFVELTPRGRRQAEAAAEMLGEVPFDRAICSGLPRTRQTAELVLHGRDLKLDEAPAFQELKPGDNSGRSFEAVQAEFIYAMDNADAPGARFVGGDIFADFYARVTEALQALLLEPGWRNLLLVAHEGTNRMLLGWAAYGGLAAVRSFEQDPCCLNVIDVDIVDGAIFRRFIKLMNATPENHAKHGNLLTSMEQVYALRDEIMRGVG